MITTLNLQNIHNSSIIILTQSILSFASKRSDRILQNTFPGTKLLHHSASVQFCHNTSPLSIVVRENFPVRGHKGWFGSRIEPNWLPKRTSSPAYLRKLEAYYLPVATPWLAQSWNAMIDLSMHAYSEGVTMPNYLTEVLGDSLSVARYYRQKNKVDIDKENFCK